MRSKRKLIISIIAAVLLVAIAVTTAIFYHKGPYTAEELGIDTVLSSRDDDGDGIDNYTDFVLSARSYIETNPIYYSSYYDGGYPTDEYGVCTDVIWQAFLGAGIDLKSLVDEDIVNFPEAYPEISKADPNIDFRRVRNLKIFFERHALSLTSDKSKTAEWQPGDIVVISPSHIAICSDKRNRKGVPYLIHHSSIGAYEADDLYLYEIVGHYRFGD